MYIIHNEKVVDKISGEIMGDIKPKFANMTYDLYKQAYPDLRYLQPMTCKEIPKGAEIPMDGYIAEEKFDGFRNTTHITSQGNRSFSRDLSKKTEWFGECSDNIPHIRDADLTHMMGTVFDSEATLPTGKFKDVAGVMGSNTLVETAIQNQLKKGFANLNVFDMLYYKGIRIENFPLWHRKLLLHKAIEQCEHDHFKEVKFYCNYATFERIEFEATKAKMIGIFNKMDIEIVSDFKSLLQRHWEEGKEGLIVKNIFGTYEQKKSGLFLKLKDMFYRDVIVMGFNPPTMEYEGKTLEEKGYWDYWEDYDDPGSAFEKRLTIKEMEERNCAPVSKPYAMGWIGSIRCGVWKDGEIVEVANIKGIKEDMCESIRKDEQGWIGKVLEIKFNEFIDIETGSVRHPRFSKVNDKPSYECTWEAYING